MNARPHLHLLVNQATGEHTERCSGCVDKERAIERLTRSYEGTIRDLRLELKRWEPDLERDEEIQRLLDFWADRVLEAKWWTLRPRFEPGDPQWRATSAARNKGYAPPYLRAVVVGALLEADQARKHHRTFRRHWLKPEMIFASGRIDTHYENAMDPRFQRVRLARELPEVLRARYWEVESQADMCVCGHIRFDHDNPRPLEGVFDPPCSIHGCAGCDGFEELT